MQPTPTLPPRSHLRSGTLFDTAAWTDAWRAATVERVERRDAVTVDLGGRSAAVPLYLVADSPFWNGYQIDAGVPPVFPGAVVTLPSLYSFYGPSYLATRPAAPAEVTDRALARARRWSAEGLLVANLSQEAAAAWSRERAPDASIRLDIAYHGPAAGGIDVVLDALPKHQRVEWRRRWRRAGEQGVRLHEATGEDATALLPRVLEIVNGSAVKHGIQPLYDLPTLSKVLSVPGGLLIRADHEGAMVAGFVAVEHDRVLYLWAGGIDYTAPSRLSPYLFLLYELFRMAPGRGWRRVEFGRGNYTFKRRYGFSGTELWSLFYAADPARRAHYQGRLGQMHERLTRFIGV